MAPSRAWMMSRPRPASTLSTPGPPSIRFGARASGQEVAARRLRADGPPSGPRSSRTAPAKSRSTPPPPRQDVRPGPAEQHVDLPGHRGRTSSPPPPSIRTRRSSPSTRATVVYGRRAGRSAAGPDPNSLRTRSRPGSASLQTIPTLSWSRRIVVLRGNRLLVGTRTIRTWFRSPGAARYSRTPVCSLSRTLAASAGVQGTARPASSTTRTDRRMLSKQRRRAELRLQRGAQQREQLVLARRVGRVGERGVPHDRRGDRRQVLLPHARAWPGGCGRSGPRASRRGPRRRTGRRPDPRARARARPSRPARAAAIRPAKCGSITAFVCACGEPAVRTSSWQVAWCTAKPVMPDAQPHRNAPSATSSSKIARAPRSAAASATGLASGV